MMRLCFAARLRAAILCGLLLLASLPAFAFDEDHHEVINGATLHFRVRGTDKAHPYLVILHGGPGFSSHMFYAWGPSLEKTLNVVSLDQRGSGESARLAVADVMAPTPAEIKGYAVANKITAPTLILNGKQDGVIPPSVAEAAHAAIKGSQLVELDNCDHFPFFEQSEKTTAAVLFFIAATRVTPIR